MMQFKINLATRTYIDKKKLDGALAATLILLAFLLLVQIKICAFNADEISRLDSTLTSAETRKGKGSETVFSEHDYTALLTEIAFANSIIERKAFGWISLLNRLESVVPDGVTLSSVEPDNKERSLSLSGGSASFKKIQLFMENLEDSHYFHEIYLLKQDQSKEADMQRSISFTITCKFAS